MKTFLKQTFDWLSDVEEESTERPLDPRAGRVDVVMPEIKFNPNEIASQLEDLKYKKFTRARNRKCLDRIITTYRKFATGIFPIGIQRLKVDRNELKKPDVHDKAIELLEFENELYGEQRELKKMAKRKRKRIVNTLYDKFEAKSNKIAKIKQDVNTWKEEDISSEEQCLQPKKKTAKGKTMDNDIVVTPNKRKSNNADSLISKKRQKSNEWTKTLEDGEVEYVIPSKKQQQNGAPHVTITKDSITTHKITPLKLSNDKKKSSPNSPKSNDTLNQVENGQTSPSKNTEALSSTLMVSKNQLQNGSPKTSEKKVKSASKLTQSANSTSKPGIFADKTAQISASTPNSTLLSAKKGVKIALKMNRSQEVNEYIRQLKQSPMAPYDSAKKPLKGALKLNLTPSPINPFYKKLIGMK